MTPKQAKLLREHGFPFKDRRCSYCQEQNYKSCTECEDIEPATLEEVIKELGDDFYGVVRSDTGDGWFATPMLTEETVNLDGSWGETPLEAVINLYCVINPKKE